MKVCAPEKCTGCGVCADACLKGCIEIRYDSDGFLQSYVDETKCVKCGKCISACPANNPNHKKEIIKVYKFRRKDTAAVLESTSGGASALLAETVIEQGGMVCGCGFGEDLVLRHSLEYTVSGIEKFKGSKYVQSQTVGIYQKVRQQLRENRKVLFVGTPCQVSGLKNYLGKEEENLITVDLACHGVASNKILSRYVDRYAKAGKKIQDIRFREKKQGYKSCNLNDLRFILPEGESVISHEKGIVLWFASGVSLRKSCYVCPFADTQRCADLTLADYSGNDLSPEDRQYGASAVFVNTEKGQRLLMAAAEQAHMEEKDKTGMLCRYIAFQKKGTEPSVRKKFFLDLDKLTLEQMEQKYVLKKILPGKITLYFKAIMRRLHIH